MQRFEKEGVAGGASWKLLKTKGNEGCKSEGWKV
jgi:hypothetical protein